MLNDLAFLKPAIPSKPMLPIFEHIRIANGTAMAGNGQMAMSTPVDTDIVATPNGGDLLSALKSSGDTFQMSLLENGNIVVKAGKFKATVRCCTEEYPSLPSGGQNIELPPIIPALKIARKFTAANTNRPWSGTTLLRGQSVWSTNNGMIVQVWLASDTAIDIGIPLEVVDTILRIGKEPDYAVVDKTWVRLHYGPKWLWFSLIEDKWPMDVEKHLKGDWENNFQSIPEGLFDHLDAIAPFVNAGKDCFIRKCHVSSHIETSEGASVELPDVDPKVSLEIKLPMLQAIEDVATVVSFGAPIRFIGENLRGIVYAEVR